jgi:hypothetical protein
VRFVLYGGHGLIDADLPGLPALRERLAQMVRRPGGLSGVFVLVFDTETDRYLGRCDILVDDGKPVLVYGGSQSPAEIRFTSYSARVAGI